MDFSIAAVSSGLVVSYDISPKALGPTRGLSAVLGRYALKWPGDCDVARPPLHDPQLMECQGCWSENFRTPICRRRM